MSVIQRIVGCYRARSQELASSMALSHHARVRVTWLCGVTRGGDHPLVVRWDPW